MSAEDTAPTTQNGQLRFLLVEDNPLDVELVQRELRRAGFKFTSAVVQTPEDFTREVHATRPHVVLADYNLPQWKGIEALEILARAGLDVPLILVTGALGEVTAVDCIKQGATDYVLKGALTRLPVAIGRALHEKRLREQRKRGEEDLAVKVDELARSNRDLEQFAYVASHDLQEPLRMVAAYTQLLAERYRGKLDENADKYIGYAVEGATRMQALIRDLLEFSRVGRNGTGGKHSDCNAALERALLNLKAAIDESGAAVNHDPLPAVAAESTLLIQLFQNLIGNAIKFRGKEAPVIRISAERQGARWQFAVADNGIGIAPEHKDVIFVIFQRLHARDEYSGNGVGLAICKKIVEHHGGRIWVESEPGHGCTFQFTLTAIPADEKDNSNDLLQTCDSAG
ncbi:MAG: ATP-binding protein [Terriglobales bacterium]